MILQVFPFLFQVAYSTEPWLLHDLTSPIFLRYFDTPVTWTEAEAICRKHFGHLVRGKMWFKNIFEIVHLKSISYYC